MKNSLPQTDISRRVWDARYRFHEAGEADVQATWQRVANALAAPEGAASGQWAQRFLSILQDFRFLPGGRVLAGAGTGHDVTLFNCFVMGVIEDSLDGIFDALKQGALTMQQGGGAGYDFSTLRPAGTSARRVGTVASGPVSFMRIWDAMCATLLSTGARRGAMMATLRCDHPDIEAFIAAKQTAGELRHFNLSVLVTDAFMQAVERDEEWPLVFPLMPGETAADTVTRPWSSASQACACRVHRRVRARELWRRILRAAYDFAEPGVVFVDTVNRLNNLSYCETLSATNPCGEIPLPPYGACDLGSVNLTRFVLEPFTPSARFDAAGIRQTVQTAVRLLDNVYEVSRFPLPQQRETARSSRRLGIGLTGLADALAMLGVPYGSEAARTLAGGIMGQMCHAAYEASVGLAREKGAFPAFDAARYLSGAFAQRLPPSLRDGIARDGLRNSHLTAIAPTGTVSLLAGNVSSGLEPIFRLRYRRRLRNAQGCLEEVEVEDYAHRLYRQRVGQKAALPEAFVTAGELPAEAHLAMQAALQAQVDNAISKTINLPSGATFEDFSGVYAQAYRLGLKGCTAFRPNPVTGEVLLDEADGAERQCCTVEREGD